ncbi:MAG: VWA domain-containing protein, partial [Polyangiales bacterium]
SGGFFAEHYTTLPDPTCGKTFCLHAMLSVTPDLVRGGDWTLLQMGMNSPIDPTKVAKPPLDIVVVLDHSGSMSGAGKMEFAKQGVSLLVDAMTSSDTFTLIEFDDTTHTIFGPGKITDKAALKSQIAAIAPAGGTNLYAGLEAGYKAALAAGGEELQRRVMFLTDGQATSGFTDSATIAKMSAGYNEKYVGLTTIGLGSDADGTLLRTLSEKGGGNYYFVESPAAVTEVFTEELAFFVAPIAYDLDLTLEQAPGFAVKEVFGTNLWSGLPGGGKVHVPSVFLVSRTSTAPGPGGGRRGGGSAIIAQLAIGPDAPTTSPYDLATLKLRYRVPGATTYEEQTVPVTHEGAVGIAPDGGFYTNKTIEKNTLILDFFVAFRDATKLAQTDRTAALKVLTDFRAKMGARIATWTDEDLVDDLKIVDQYVALLKTLTGAP